MKKDVKRGTNIFEICFIVCTNNQDYLNECKFYIEQLHVPKDMKVSLISVEKAKSMTSGYNEAMRASNARYKVYLHQDVFIINRNFIYDILACFVADETIGMIGVAGTRHLPENADAWKSLDVGGCISIGTFSGAGYIAIKPEGITRQEDVEFIDGMLMATAYDIEWDERIDGFHFYDVTQCVNFSKAGLRIVVAEQEDQWVFHDFGPLNLETYNLNRKKLCNIYEEFNYEKSYVQDNTIIYKQCDRIASVLKTWINNQKYEDIINTIKEIDNAIYFNQDLLTIYFVLEIYTLEKMMGLETFINIPKDNAFEHLERKFFKLKWLMIRNMVFNESSDYIANLVSAGTYSVIAVIVIALHNIPSQNMHVLEEVGSNLVNKAYIGADEWEKCINFVKKYEKENVPSAEEI